MQACVFNRGGSGARKEAVEVEVRAVPLFWQCKGKRIRLNNRMKDSNIFDSGEWQHFRFCFAVEPALTFVHADVA